MYFIAVAREGFLFMNTSTEVILSVLSIFGIRGVERYIEEFQGKVFVVKAGGALLEDRATGALILDDLAILTRCGVRPILVHGGGVQADREMKDAGIEVCRYKGLRITCDKTIRIIERCFCQLNESIIQRLQFRGVNAVGFSGRKGGGLVRAGRYTPDGQDIGHVGDVTGINMRLIEELPPDALPVIASLGVDTDDNVLNINADYIASPLALHLDAEKLILLTDVLGVLRDRNDPDTLIPSMTTNQARALIRDGIIDAGMVPKVESIVRMLERGLKKVHMISGRVPHALAREIFTDEGCGTQIVKGDDSSHG
jgi:acetylglutamate kinase